MMAGFNARHRLGPQAAVASLNKKLKQAGVVMALLAAKPSGQAYPQLSPRTLPNGIANSPTVQRVSGDVVLQASDMSIVTSATNVDQVSIGIAKLVGIIDSGVVDGIATKVASTNSVPLNGASANDVTSIGKHYLTGSSFRIIVAKGTTLEQAQALLTGTVIRYQLATPIDTLNVPFTNPLIDLANSVGKNLFDYFGSNVILGTAARNIPNGFNVAGTVAYNQNYIDVTNIPPGTYTISYDFLQKGTQTTIDFSVREFGSVNPIYNGSTIASLSGRWRTTFTIPAGKSGFRVYMYSNVTSTVMNSSCDFTNIQLELGSTATAYEPYKKNNALLTNFAGTQTDGYTLEATVNSNGQAVGYDNLLLNANLVDGDVSGIADNWASLVGTTLTTCAGGIQKFTPTAQFGQIRQTIDGTFSVGQRWLLLTDVKATKSTVQIGIQTSQVQSQTGVNTHTGNGQYQRLSQIITITNAVTQLIVRVRDDGTSGWAEIEFTKPLLIRLDDNPQITAFETQLGKPLDAPACDRIFPFVATTGVTYVSARPYLSTDGIDSYGLLANNPSVDIVGTEDFAIAWCGITPSALQTGWIKSKNLSAQSDMQYGVIIVSDGSVLAVLNGTDATIAPIGTIKTNAQTKIDVERKGGRLKCWVNDVLTYDQPNTASLVSRPNFRLFARSSNVGGTTHLLFFKGLTAYLILARGTYGDLDKLDGVLDKVARDYR